MTTPPSKNEIQNAYQLIENHIRKTPILQIDGTAFEHDTPVTLKLELLQHSGSFKARGAFYNLISRDIPASGLAAASGGNHGAACAYAAQKLGIKARIFVPDIASPAKIDKIKAYGASAIVKGERYADSLTLCDTYQRDSGAIGLHAYDGFHTICGQGTLGYELSEQMKDNLPDTILVAVGGGGLISGLASWFGKKVKIVGVEPQTSCAMQQALKAGAPIDVEVSGIAADSLGAKRVGQMAFYIAQNKIDTILTLSDNAIAKAQATLWNDYHLAAEAGGAAAFAALQSGAYKPKPGEKVAIILCGSNIELEKLADITKSS
ncbi:MAG: threonine/serine dehydratase [Cohaesibacter sp.]|nr:threonine/serine dehydratase [Cohaesibacter sp.]